MVLALCALGVQAAVPGVYDVRDYGAKGDGKALDHVAINKAIEAATKDGGGQVVLSAGTYLCGSIRLKSNVDLHLMAGAKILAAPAEMKAYDESESFGGFPEYQDGGHTYFHNSLIWAEGQQNVSITGHGMIDGEGLTKHDTEKAAMCRAVHRHWRQGHRPEAVPQCAHSRHHHLPWRTLRHHHHRLRHRYHR